MKQTYKIILLASFLLITINNIQSQAIEPELNQIALMKQFIGSWESDFGNGTVLTSNNKPFGAGLISTSEILKNGN